MANNGNGNGTEYFEKPWFKSKKFMAFLLTELAMIGITIATLLTQKIGWELAGYMVCIVFVMGWTTTLFMGKQAELDMFIHGITMTGQIPDRFKGKVLEPKEKGDVPSETPPSSVPPAN